MLRRVKQLIELCVMNMVIKSLVCIENENKISQSEVQWK
jgi:hypothetical protein